MNGWKPEDIPVKRLHQNPLIYFLKNQPIEWTSDPNFYNPKLKPLIMASLEGENHLLVQYKVA